MIRRALLTLLSIVALAGPAAAADPLPPVRPDEPSVGRADAPVTVVEYRSFVCPHCGEWHRDVYAQFKARYIDTGKVRLVFRDMLTNPAQAAASAAGVARCAAPANHAQVSDILFRTQLSIQPIPDTEANWAYSQRVNTWLNAAIAASGRTQAEMTACLSDPATLGGIRQSVTSGLAAGVQGTPTFFVNGQKVEGTGSLEQLSAAIDPLVR